MAGNLTYKRMGVNPLYQKNFEAFKSERKRLETFFTSPGWPVSFIRPEDCASAGFFSLQDGDKVQCAFCKGVIGEWEQGDNPMTEHRRHFTCCPFICGLPVGNISLNDESAGASSLNSELELGSGRNMRGRYVSDLTQLNSTADKTAAVRNEQPSEGTRDEDVIGMSIKICGNGPAHSNLVTLSSRVNTFTNWPMDIGKAPDMLAEAGFFYCGRGDAVRCFYCNGGLRDWQASDDPWVEHARWFSNCTYTLLMKGEGFVKEVNRINPPTRLEVQDQVLCETSKYVPRVFSYQELLDLMSTPIVQAVLEMGIDYDEILVALRLKIQRTGEPFLTTEALLKTVFEQNMEDDSDSEFGTDSDSDVTEIGEDEYLNPASGNTRSSDTSTSVQSASHLQATSSSATMQAPLNLNVSTNSGTKSVIPSCSKYNKEVEYAHEAIKKLDKGTAIEKEKQDLSEQNLCKICMDCQVGIVFLPCGHLVSCTRCATALSKCALCRQQIKAVVRAFLS